MIENTKRASDLNPRCDLDLEGSNIQSIIPSTIPAHEGCEDMFLPSLVAEGSSLQHFRKYCQGKNATTTDTDSGDSDILPIPSE